MCEHHRILLHSMRAKRKRKDSEEENDYQPEVKPTDVPTIISSCDMISCSAIGDVVFLMYRWIFFSFR